MAKLVYYLRQHGSRAVWESIACGGDDLKLHTKQWIESQPNFLGWQEPFPEGWFEEFPSDDALTLQQIADGTEEYFYEAKKKNKFQVEIIEE